MATKPLTGLAEHLRGTADTMRTRPRTDATDIAVECFRQWADEVAAAQAVPMRLEVWFGQWELILPQDARESFRELLAELRTDEEPPPPTTGGVEQMKEGG